MIVGEAEYSLPAVTGRVWGRGEAHSLLVRRISENACERFIATAAVFLFSVKDPRSYIQEASSQMGRRKEC